MQSNLTPAEIEKRFAAINARPSEALTPDEEAALAAAEAMDDGSTVSLAHFRAQKAPRRLTNHGEAL